MPGLYWNTVNDLLKEALVLLMAAPEFREFRLVGGTSLGLQIGHRVSVDIDLFTDADYGTIDFAALEDFLKKSFAYVSANGGQVAMGTSYFAGSNENDAVKIDLYYTDDFIRPPLNENGIRLATVEEILAMKLDVVSRGGRKKDFWDIHALLEQYSLTDMLQLHKERYPYGHDEEAIRRNMVDFSEADNDFDPQCLRGKFWELIKYDIMRWAR